MEQRRRLCAIARDRADRDLCRPKSISVSKMLPSASANENFPNSTSPSVRPATMNRTMRRPALAAEALA
jgi:hypothetical protein